MDNGKRISTTRRTIDTATIPGWGVDANPENDPTYPYRDRSKNDHSGVWVRPAQQVVEIEVLQSIEHKHRPAVVGTSTPPSGLSGALRRLAFHKSESNLLHWIGLLGADRINVVEGLLQDLGHARVPNILGEMGARAEWRFNQRGFVVKTVVVIGVLAVIGASIAAKRNSRRELQARR